MHACLSASRMKIIKYWSGQKMFQLKQKTWTIRTFSWPAHFFRKPYGLETIKQKFFFLPLPRRRIQTVSEPPSWTTGVMRPQF